MTKIHSISEGNDEVHIAVCLLFHLIYVKNTGEPYSSDDSKFVTLSS